MYFEKKCIKLAKILVYLKNNVYIQKKSLLLLLTMKIKFLTFSCLFAASLFLVSCGEPKKNEEKADTTSAKTETKENLKKALAEAPKPSELPYQLQATGTEFNANIPNPHTNVEKYKTTNAKAALNLGVYATDLGYLSAFQKVQNGLDYVKAVKSLADKLGVSTALDPKMQERFEKNLKNVDTLSNIINDAIGKADGYLKNNKQANIATLIAAGTLVEGLYVATQIISTYPKDLLPEDAKNQILSGLVRIIVDQQKTLGDVLSALKSLEKDEEVTKVIAQLEELQKIYGDLNIKEKLEKNQGGALLTDKNIQGITNKVKEIRAQIIS
ncbi:MAG: hypothetical protein EAZ85_09040 [Bacteroidetes bacterium]|nr:MAG: hypothetical protein EAZ85_09040 [Bacteroidota bacterium]TAG88062.1 MAG: hypothetical protein EAZ20_09375 [Bacteroidota bacterium]